MRCADDVSIDQLAAEGIGGTHMFTGADLAGLCRRAVTFAFMEDDNAQVCLPRWGRVGLLRRRKLMWLVLPSPGGRATALPASVGGCHLFRSWHAAAAAGEVDAVC